MSHPFTIWLLTPFVEKELFSINTCAACTNDLSGNSELCDSTFHYWYQEALPLLDKTKSLDTAQWALLCYHSVLVYIWTSETEILQSQ